MDYNNLKGRYFGNDTFAKKGENGMWEVTVIIRERVSEDGENWVEESIGASAMDADFTIAHKLCLMSVLGELNDLVYSKGIDSLVQGLEIKRKSEEDNESSAENNKDTSIQ